MIYTPVILALAAGDWFTVWKGWRHVEYVLKPAVMVVLIAWLIGVTGMAGPAPWFVAGLVLSLAGDVFLMLPRFPFVLGLAAFLVAQLCYAAGFLADFPPLVEWSLLIVFAVCIPAALLYRRVVTGEGLRKHSPGLRTGVLAYTIAISVMTISAALTTVHPGWDKAAALLAALGAVFFFASDAVLALNRFVAPIRNGRVVNMILYHLGQILIVFGVAQQLGSI